MFDHTPVLRDDIDVSQKCLVSSSQSLAGDGRYRNVTNANHGEDEVGESDVLQTNNNGRTPRLEVQYGMAKISGGRAEQAKRGART